MQLWNIAACYLLLATACSYQDNATSNERSVSESVVTIGYEIPDSVSLFVQNFYDWYTPVANHVNEEPAWISALKFRESNFTPELTDALRADYKAQAGVEGEIIGLDFDPFLGSQDPCGRYEVGRVILKDQHYWVDVHGVCSGERSERPNVIAELASQNGSWVFVNFHFPTVQTHLLEVLK